MSAHWRLFVDESGPMEDLSARVAVGGWLVQSDILDSAHELLQRRSRELGPRSLWPWHQRLLRHPISIALGWHLDGEPPGAPWAAPATQAMAGVVHRQPRPLATALEDVRQGRVPSREVLLRLDRSLRPRVRRRLERHAADLRVALTRILRDLASLQYLGEERPGPCAFLVASGETARGDAVTLPHGAPTDRYVGLLRCLFDRVVRVVSTLGGRTLSVDVLNRACCPVESEPPRHLRPGDVRGWLQKAIQLAGVDLRLDRTVPEEWNGRTSAELMLADFVVHVTCHPLAGTGPLDATEGTMVQRTGLPPRAARSHLSATGRGWRIALGLEPPVTRARFWPLEQAGEWAP